tara:strand:- start:16 stop:444 length:429 start_codon:yes stop_codon:yes gene_type:complete
MNKLDVGNLLNALDNDSNSSIMNYTSKKIKKFKNDILQQIQLPRELLKSYHKKLKEYRYCSEMCDLQDGYYIRWISLKNPDNVKLTNGAHILDILIKDKGAHVLCKNNRNRIFQIKFDEVIIFQKLSQQEKIILGVLDYLDK